MILHSDQEGNDCIRKLRCHCIQILHSDIYSVSNQKILNGIEHTICISTKNHIGIHKWFDTIVSTILGHVVVADGSMESSGIVKDFKLGIEKKCIYFCLCVF